jgi:DNA repair exonuclease SbcCD ATPase subunit
MQVTLDKLVIKNFKGISDLTINFTDETSIIGDNGTGKTSIVDSFYWLFFDKNSEGDTVFNVKPLNQDNTIKHRLTTSVEAIVDVDGTKTTYLREYKEKWTKKRNNPLEELTGHESVYYIDAVPVNKTEFTMRIKNTFKEDKVFKLCSDIRYFKSCKWEEKRSLLTGIVIIPSDEEILAMFPELDLQGKTVDERRAMLKASITRLNDEIEYYQPRVNELNNLLDKTTNFEELNAELKSVNSELETLRSKKKLIEESLSKQNLELSELTSRKIAISNKIRVAESEKTSNVQTYKSNLLFAKTTCESKIKEANNKVQQSTLKSSFLSKELDELNSKIEQLRDDYIKANESYFDASAVTDKCPTCNQDLENTEYREKLIEEMKHRFNKDKIINVNSAKNKGQELKQIIASKESEINGLQIAIEESQSAIIILTDELARVESDIKTQSKVAELEKEYSDEINSLKKQLSEIESKIEEFTELQEQSFPEESKIKELSDRSYELVTKLAGKANNDKIQEQINTRTEAHKANIDELSKAQYELSLIDAFVSKKALMVEENVNNLFGNGVKFKMFDKQVNGELKPTCEILINGVPISDANTASVINAGIEIVGTFQHALNFYAPVFVDNCESVTRPIGLNCQMIRMYVKFNSPLTIS